MTDASTLLLDTLIDAAFAGRTGEVETQLNKALTGGTSPASIISAGLRQISTLHKARLAIEDGKSVTATLDTMVPPVHFSRKTLVEVALKGWTAARLERAMLQFADASLEARRNADLAETIAQRVLLSLAVTARRKE